MAKEVENPQVKKKSKVGLYIYYAIILLVLLVVAFMLIYSRQLFGDEVGDAILGKDVPNGWVGLANFFIYNASALLWSLLTIIVLIFLTSLLFLIINLTLRKTARLVTIGSLLKSLVKYVNIVAGICIVLGIWGVNVAGIFAGLGIIALIIGLGCKTLVNDIVSGFFIVVDNYFEVGDKVTIDGFTGTVQTIGLRTTKVKDWQGNEKSINNSLITTVVNLSRFESFASVSIDISFNEDLRRVEAIVVKNLDKIKEKIPTIIEGPFYKGVNELDDCGVQLMFNAKVKEWDRVATQRALLRELYLLFVEEDIIIPFKQLVVNAPDPVGKPRATKEEIEQAEKYLFPEKAEEVKKKKGFLSALGDKKNYTETGK